MVSLKDLFAGIAIDAPTLMYTKMAKYPIIYGNILKIELVNSMSHTYCRGSILIVNLGPSINLGGKEVKKKIYSVPLICTPGFQIHLVTIPSLHKRQVKIVSSVLNFTLQQE